MPASGADVSRDECVTEKGQVRGGDRHGCSGQYSYRYQAATTEKLPGW